MLKLDVASADADAFSKSFGKVNKTMDKGRASMKDINFEFLGVMFFGQAVSKVLGEMLKPALDVFGVFDLWGLTLKVVFLPVIEQIFPWLLKMMKSFMEMPEGVKLTLGWIVLLGWGLFSMIGTIGTLVLGIESMAIAFTGSAISLSTLVAGAKTAIGILGELAGVVLILVSIGLIIDSAMKDGLQIWQDIAAGVAGGLGLALISGAGVLGTIGLMGAVISFAIGVDLLFDSMKRPGMQIFQDLIAGFLIGAGFAAAAGVIAGSMTVALGVATITIPVTMILAVSLDWMLANAGDNPNALVQSIAGKGVSFGAGLTPDLPAGLQSQIGSNFDNYSLQSKPGFGSNTSTVINNEYNITTNDDRELLRLFAEMERNIIAQTDAKS